MRLFKQFDPRIRLLWWLAASALAMTFRRVEPLGLLILLICWGWLSVGAGRQLLRFTIGLLPFLVIISIISLFPSLDVQRSIRMALRYFALLATTTLVISTTSYGEITNALRNLARGRVRFLHKPVELFSLVFGLAFLTVPLASEEWQSVKEVQRARGMDIGLGGRFQQVRRGLDLLQPLILRILDRIRHFGISIITLSYNPFASRTLYRELALTRVDRISLWACLALLVSGIGLGVGFGL